MDNVNEKKETKTTHTFRVWARCSHYCYLDVEAENEAEARDMAEETDGGEFNEGWYKSTSSDWEILPDISIVA